MSRTRTGLGSEDWRDDGPAAARTHNAIWGTHNATVVGAMLPMVRLPNALTNADVRHARKNAANREAKRERELRGDPRPNTPRCGAPLPVVKEPCARYAGHRDSHRSQFALDNNAGRWRS